MSVNKNDESCFDEQKLDISYLDDSGSHVTVSPSNLLMKFFLNAQYWENPDKS